MKTPQPLPEPLGSSGFTFQEAADAGATVGRLRHRSLVVPSRGIRQPLHQTFTELSSVVRPLTLITEFSAASHATAFTLWSFPGFLPGSDDPITHISRPDTMAMPRRAGVRGHRGQFFDDEIVNLNGLLVTSRTRTWLDCARKMSIDEMTVVADHLLRIPRPDSEPQLNVPVELVAGVVRQPDLAYPEQKVAVEYDGEGHSETAQIVRDIAREEDFARAGWLMVRISRRHMENEARVAVAKVRLALTNRGWSPK